MIFQYITMNWDNAKSISGCDFRREAARELYAFTKQLIGGVPHIYA